ncbi:MAG: hypothetical protein ACOX52_23210 [Verrucomicrobiota bacterium]
MSTSPPPNPTHSGPLTSSGAPGPGQQHAKPCCGPPTSPDALQGHQASGKLCQHRNNTVAVPGFICPNPITRPFDTETDSDPAPELASPLPFSDDRW